MKEVMAIVRQNKVNVTKEALASAGIPAFTCRKVLGRGKKLIDMNLITTIVENGELPLDSTGEHLSETTRLIPKRVFTLVVEDAQVSKVVDAIMEVNSTDNPGDGKIFVLPIYENYQVRNGEATTEAY
ncbi:nitrogen regulatory protein P-II family [Anaerocolumna jejuensis DSM 15929]|uniref:Nitrogen regulatory protein P-II family n=1 Tax=Anaerocolumna jejuensis DSM 15929 TaxID=1121322 RepID=A0A1M7AFA4_9FIRM|nr:P-II family nitrogen regulator [Anaerocolumna jejuensis]SHL41169.1 nitrogen regulatory protein P-II family [Anaerocolumna jejuensis DSM 15929]